MNLPQRLCDGYWTFRTGRLPTEQSRYRELAERGQKPETLVIGCCDSRVSPEVIFDAAPGELFVMRNVANLVPPYEPARGHHGVSSALEYAIEVLEVKNVLVLGHARCGGIRAFAQLEPGGDFIGKWLSLLAPVVAAIPAHERALGSYLTRLELASVIASLESLKTFPFVRRRIEWGKLRLHGAYFDVATGDLAVLDPATGRFVPVTRPAASPG
jgi:carbonic anhydrase